MKTLDELDALHAAATAGEWDALKCEVRHAAPRASGVNYHASRADADFTATAKNNWPAFSARLRAAEAEVERLRGALRGAIEELDTIPEDPKRFARVAGMTIPLVRGGLAKALLPAKARAALGEP
ncbi:MAG: hypothetical protein IPF92_21630 [Myxococcales bacterium]|nr:hypothetical protein [Myxococcales bacterium]